METLSLFFMSRVSSQLLIRQKTPFSAFVLVSRYSGLTLIQNLVRVDVHVVFLSFNVGCLVSLC